MASLNVKLPDEQKEEVEGMAEAKNYNSTSEYVREALRDKVEKDRQLRSEIIERLNQVKEGDIETLSVEEVRQQLTNRESGSPVRVDLSKAKVKDRKADDRGRISLPPSDYAGREVKVVLVEDVVLVIDRDEDE